jgi:hypothetical protein
MQSRINEIQMKKILSAAITEDEISINLSGAWSISLYNPVSLWAAGSVCKFDESDLVNRTIIGAVVEAKTLTLELDNASKLVVDLSDAAYRGPEAAVLRGARGEFIVVN